MKLYVMCVAKTYPFYVGFPGVELVVAFPEIRRGSVMEKKNDQSDSYRSAISSDFMP